MNLLQKLQEKKINVGDLTIESEHAYGVNVKSTSGGMYFIYNKTLNQCDDKSVLYVSNMKTPKGVPVLVLTLETNMKDDF